jgi:hypothetical protein
MQQIFRVITRKPRFSLSISQDLYDWLGEQAELEHTQRPKIIERIIRERMNRSPYAITIELTPEAIDQLKQAATREMRSFEAQIAWIVSRWLEMGGGSG